MNAPMTMDALADVARALGFELRRAEHAVPAGVDYDRAKEQTQFGLFCDGQIVFDGTSRECSAFLIGWRDLRSSMLGALRAVDSRVRPEMSAVTRCLARDPSDPRGDHCCLLPVDHECAHSALRRWQDKPR